MASKAAPGSAPIGLLDAPRAALGESPFWDAGEQALYWCDISGRALHRHHPASGTHRRWPLDSEPGSCAPMLGGGLLLALRSGLHRFDPVRGSTRLLVRAPYDPRVQRFNDGKADPRGAFWVGTLHEPRDAPRAALYRYAGGELVRMAGGVTVSNGLAWSPDGRTMYWSDTSAHAVYAVTVDLASADMSERRVFARFAARDPAAPAAAYGGRPDGAAVDAEGCYWVAMYEGARLLRLAPDGRQLSEIRLPVARPTMPAFGGPDLRTLYVTSAAARPGDATSLSAWAGGVLHLRVEVPGLPVHFVA